MKKLDFPNCIKIYNKTLASDIVSVSELSKNLSNKKSLFTFGKDINLENIMKYSDVNRESIFVDYDSNFRNSLNQQPEVFEKILNHLSKLKKKYNIKIIDLNKKRNYGNI